MVGIFSKFSKSKSGLRRTRSAIDEKEVLTENPQATEADIASSSPAFGIELATEFKPIEHPTEPFDHDRPIECPQPEPSILNDGRLWKERISAANVRRLSESNPRPVGNSEASGASGTRRYPPTSNRMMLPSQSAPEHNIINLLEECNASGMFK